MGVLEEGFEGLGDLLVGILLEGTDDGTEELDNADGLELTHVGIDDGTWLGMEDGILVGHDVGLELGVLVGEVEVVSNCRNWLIYSENNFL